MNLIIKLRGDSSSGHVCHSPQHASSPVFVSSSRASSTGNRCSITRLAQEVDVHVSTISPAQQSQSEAQDHSGGQGNTHRHLLAVTTMVSTPVCGPPTILSIPPRPTVTTGICHERQVVPSARVEGLMQHYQAAGFCRLATAPRRPSTNRINGDRWLGFANWATGQGFDPLGPTAAQIGAFLCKLINTYGLSPQTIKGYRSCLASVLSRTGRTAAVQPKTINMIKGIYLTFGTFSKKLGYGNYTSLVP